MPPFLGPACCHSPTSRLAAGCVGADTKAGKLSCPRGGVGGRPEPTLTTLTLPPPPTISAADFFAALRLAALVAPGSAGKSSPERVPPLGPAPPAHRPPYAGPAPAEATMDGNSDSVSTGRCGSTARLDGSPLLCGRSATLSAVAAATAAASAACTPRFGALPLLLRAANRPGTLAAPPMTTAPCAPAATAARLLALVLAGRESSSPGRRYCNATREMMGGRKEEQDIVISLVYFSHEAHLHLY